MRRTLPGPSHVEPGQQLTGGGLGQLGALIGQESPLGVGLEPHGRPADPVAGGEDAPLVVTPVAAVQHHAARRAARDDDDVVLEHHGQPQAAGVEGPRLPEVGDKQNQALEADRVHTSRIGPATGPCGSWSGRTTTARDRRVFAGVCRVGCVAGSAQIAQFGMLALSLSASRRYGRLWAWPSAVLEGAGPRLWTVCGLAVTARMS